MTIITVTVSAVCSIMICIIINWKKSQTASLDEMNTDNYENIDNMEYANMETSKEMPIFKNEAYGSHQEIKESMNNDEIINLQDVVLPEETSTEDHEYESIS